MSQWATQRERGHLSPLLALFTHGEDRKIEVPPSTYCFQLSSVFLGSSPLFFQFLEEGRVRDNIYSLSTQGLSDKDYTALSLLPTGPAFLVGTKSELRYFRQKETFVFL